MTPKGLPFPTTWGCGRSYVSRRAPSDAARPSILTRPRSNRCTCILSDSQPTTAAVASVRHGVRAGRYIHACVCMARRAGGVVIPSAATCQCCAAAADAAAGAAAAAAAHSPVAPPTATASTTTTHSSSEGFDVASHNNSGGSGDDDDAAAGVKSKDEGQDWICYAASALWLGSLSWRTTTASTRRQRRVRGRLRRGGVRGRRRRRRPGRSRNRTGRQEPGRGSGVGRVSPVPCFVRADNGYANNNDSTDDDDDGDGVEVEGNKDDVDDYDGCC
jgi:hypothetical protein